MATTSLLDSPRSPRPLQQQKQQPAAVSQMSEADLKNACEKVVDAVRRNDTKKIKRYLNRYSTSVAKIFTMAGPDGWSAITAAADFGNVEILQMAVEAHIPLHWADGHGWLALHVAVFQGHTDVVRYLIEEVKTNVDYRSRSGWTALHVAVRRGDIGLVRMLVDEGHADVNVGGVKGWTALHLAAVEGRHDVLEILLASSMKPDLSVLTDRGVPPVYIAAQNGHAHLVQAMSAKLEPMSKRQIDGWAAIHIAAACGHESVVGVLLQQQAFIDFQTAAGGQTALYLAARNGHQAIVSQLLDSGADVNLATKEEGWTPLAAACASGHASVVRLLRTRGRARLDDLTTAGETPVYLAAAGNHRDVIKELLESKVDGVQVNMPNSDGQTALFAAVHHNSAEVIDMLLSIGADPCARDSAGRTCLHAAARSNRSGSIQKLTDWMLAQTRRTTSSAVNPDGGSGSSMSFFLESRDDAGATPAHVAAQFGSREALIALKLAGADMNAQTNDGRTPLFLAAQAGHKKVIEILIQYSVDLDLPECHGWAPLHAASGSGHLDVVDCLIQAGAERDCRAADETSCLYLAAYSGHAEVVTRLLAAGVKVNGRTSNGWTPLHACAETGNCDIARLLLAVDTEKDVIDPAATSKTGDTPLHTAARWGHAKFVEILAARYRTDENIDPQCTIDDFNNVGYSPLKLASRFGHAEAAKVLLDAGADSSRPDPVDGTTSLHVAARNGHTRVVRMLLNAANRRSTLAGLDSPGANDRIGIDLPDEEGWTALHWAAAAGHAEVVELLIEYDADCDAVTKSGDCPLHLAVRNGHVNAVQRLVVDGKAELDKKGVDGLTVLRAALSAGRQDIADVLLKNGANTDL